MFCCYPKSKLEARAVGARGSSLHTSQHGGALERVEAPATNGGSTSSTSSGTGLLSPTGQSSVSSVRVISFVSSPLSAAEAGSRASSNTGLPDLNPAGTVASNVKNGFVRVSFAASQAAVDPGSVSRSMSRGPFSSTTDLSSSAPSATTASTASSSGSISTAQHGYFGPPHPSNRRRSTRRGWVPRPGVDASRVFAYAELCAATHDFSDACLIGKGGFGVVYKGVLTNGMPVAIKGTRHLDKDEDEQQLLNEVAVLSKLNHRNLVRLLGWCVPAADEDMLLLVYEFVPNGTLLEHLHPASKLHQQQQQQQQQAGGTTTSLGGLDWATRFRIAIQIAEALKYLHVQVTPPVVHRDVKTANILLDAAWNAKVADFGLSRFKEDETATHVSTMVKGTPGYLDPDYFLKYQLTDKSDVYSFGVVLLELLTGRKPVDQAQPSGQQNLAVVCVPSIVGGWFMELLDPRLVAHIDLTSVDDKSRGRALKAVMGVARLAVACLVHDTQSRPSMSQVVEMLHKIKGSDLRPEVFYAGNPYAHGAGARPQVR